MSGDRAVPGQQLQVGSVTAAKLAANLLQFILLIALSRLLGPVEIGVYALASMIWTFSRLSLDSAFGAALTQRLDISGDDIISALVGAASSAAIVCALLVVFAPEIAGLVQVDHFETIVLGCASVIVADALGVVPKALLQRRLTFVFLAHTELAALAIAGLSALFLAYRGFGAWALVVQAFLQAALTCAATMLAVRSQLSGRFRLAAIARHWRFSSALTLFIFVNYWGRNAINAVIGRLLGMAPLGLFSRSYALINLPVGVSSGIANPMLFARLAKVQTKRAESRELFLNALQAVTALVFPAYAVLAVASKNIVLVLFGPAWLGMTEHVRTLALAGFALSLIDLCGPVFMGSGRTRHLFVLGIVGACIVCGCAVAGALLGTLGLVSAGFALANWLALLPTLFLVCRQLGISFSMLVERLAPMIGAAMLTAVAIAAVAGSGLTGVSPLATLAAELSVAATLWLLFALWAYPRWLLDAVKALWSPESRAAPAGAK